MKNNSSSPFQLISLPELQHPYIASPDSKPYEKSQEKYTKQGLPQSSLYILKAMTRSPKIPVEYKSFPLLKLFQDTCKELQLNELELIMWHILLEKIVWVKPISSLMVLFLYSGYCAKSCMNFSEDLEGLNLYIGNKFKGFFNGFNRWSADNMDKLYVPIREFNWYVSKISCLALVDMTNYNFLVDEVLIIAPPNLVESEIELVFEEDIDYNKLPELLNLNSVLQNESFTLPPLDSWVSQEMVKDLDRIEM